MRGHGHQPFSFTWALIIVATFIGLQVVMGVLVGRVLFPHLYLLGHRLALEGLLNLVSYFIGGILIGVFSPRIRVLEPAVGALIAVGLMLTLNIFTPLAFLRFSLTKMILGGAMAFFIALTGAKLGERLTGYRV